MQKGNRSDLPYGSCAPPMKDTMPAEAPLATEASNAPNRSSSAVLSKDQRNHLSGRYHRAFSDWSPIGRKPATAVIGIFDGEGIGPELMTVCRLILARVGRCAGQQFSLESGGVIGTPAFHATGNWVTPETEEFCHAIHARHGAILCGPGGGRFVYDLRRCLNLFCKLVPLRPTAALKDIGPLRPEALAGVDMLVVRENMGGLY